MEWKEGPKSIPAGAKVAVLEGDPTKEGPFVMRLRLPDGYGTVVGDGWPCWAFSNHDIMRHVSRWAGPSGLDHDRLAKLAAGILFSLRGSVCLYQGEELGLN
jgi:hypothetical protein